MNSGSKNETDHGQNPSILVWHFGGRPRADRSLKSTSNRGSSPEQGSRMIQVIFSQCVYDVDGRYVDMSIRPALPITDDGPFILILSDRSNTEDTDCEIELYLTRDDLKLVIDRLTEVLENE